MLGQLAVHVAAMLADGIDPAVISRGLERFRARPLHPSVLPSMVNEELNPPAAAAAAGRYGGLDQAAADYAVEAAP